MHVVMHVQGHSWTQNLGGRGHLSSLPDAQATSLMSVNFFQRIKRSVNLVLTIIADLQLLLTC